MSDSMSAISQNRNAMTGQPSNNTVPAANQAPVYAWLTGQRHRAISIGNISNAIQSMVQAYV